MSSSSRLKRYRNKNSAATISAWGTSTSATFYSSVSTVPWPDNVPPSSGPLTQTRKSVDKQKPVSGKARRHPDGWRSPTPFRSYVCRLIPGPPFNYMAANSAGDRVYHAGPRGYNPSLSQMSIYSGTSGTGRFPRTSENTVNRATTEALNKLADSSANLGESFATMGQTIGMIAEAASRMLDVYRALKARQAHRAREWDRVHDTYESLPASRKRKITKSQFLQRRGLPRYRPNPEPLSKSASSAWLELHYGWMPLVADIQFAMGFLRDGLPKLRVTAIRNVTEDHGLPVKTGTVAPYIQQISGSVKSGCKVRIDCSLTHPNLVHLNSLGLINPFQLGWELLPFSFVLDWLLPIGNALKALSTPFGLDLKGISTTRWTKSNVTYRWTQYPGYEKGTPIVGTTASMATYRTVSFFWPTPRTYHKSPFNLTRAVTALALLQQLR